MDGKRLVERNTSETIREEELTEILHRIDEREDVRAYIGFEPSGPVHLGTWLSILKLLDVQRAGFIPVVLLADRHAYKSGKGELDWLQKVAEYWEAVFRALGLTEAEYRLGSDFQRSEDYREDLETLKDSVTVNRALRALGDVADDSESATVSQIEYPLMQALDIKHLGVELAMGGTDQRKIHVLAREELGGVEYGEPTVVHFDLLPALTGTGYKMSSSKPETMFPLHASEQVVHDRVKAAFFDPQHPVSENPVLTIAKRFIFQRNEHLEIETEYVSRRFDSFEDLHMAVENWADDHYDGSDTIHPADVKRGVADWLAEKLNPVRQTVNSNPHLLEPFIEN